MEEHPEVGGDTAWVSVSFLRRKYIWLLTIIVGLPIWDVRYLERGLQKVSRRTARSTYLSLAMSDIS